MGIGEADIAMQARSLDGGYIGYPRTVQRPDGTIVTVYYFNDRPDGERYIAATLWKPQDAGIV